MPPPHQIVLREWETLSPDTDECVAGLSLGDDSALEGLARELSERGLLGVAQLRSGLQVRATSFVGRVGLGSVEIVVSPKIPGLTLLHLLRYAYGLRNLELYGDVEHAFQRGGFQELLVSQLAEEAEELVARGLRREYQLRRATLAVPRGRIDFQTLARRRPGETASLPCQHHPRVEDCLVNQVLLAGVRLAIRVTQEVALRARLQRTAAQLADAVSDVDLSPHLLARLDRHTSRLTTAYQPAVALIELLVTSQGTRFEGAKTPIPLPGFLFDMNHFFQALLGRFLHDNIPGYELKEQYMLKDMLAYAAGYNPLSRRAPRPRPDFVVMRQGHPVAMVDAKYRDLWDQSLPEHMLYQLCAYALSRESGGTATILYPTLHEEASEARINIREPVYGGNRGQVVLRPVHMARLERLVATAPAAPPAARVAYARYLALGERGS